MFIFEMYYILLAQVTSIKIKKSLVRKITSFCPNNDHQMNISNRRRLGDF